MIVNRGEWVKVVLTGQDEQTFAGEVTAVDAAGMRLVVHASASQRGGSLLMKHAPTPDDLDIYAIPWHRLDEVWVAYPRGHSCDECDVTGEGMWDRAR